LAASTPRTSDEGDRRNPGYAGIPAGSKSGYVHTIHVHQARQMNAPGQLPLGGDPYLSFVRKLRLI